VVIKASAAAEIRTLTDALGSPDDVQRETAIARLCIIGERAVDRLVEAYGRLPARSARLAVLRVLESVPDRRSLGVARAALAEGDEVAAAGTALLRALLDSSDDQAAAGALELLVDAVRNPSATRRVRRTATAALDSLPAEVKGRVRDTLARAGAGVPIGQAAAGTADDDVWSDAVEGQLPVDPGALREAAAKRGTTAPLAAIGKMIDTVRAREAACSGPERAGWEVARGALHQALALRRCRVAIYDLRETIERSTGRLPVSFLTALHLVGDTSCLEPLASACDRSPEDDAWWRLQLAGAFQAIVKRERLTRRHAVMKRIATRWPGAAAVLMRSGN
jgi:hypothetical protein